MASLVELEGQTRAYVRRAHERIGRATFEDLLAFLKVRDIAPGSTHSKFNALFGGSSKKAKSAFIRELRRQATAPSTVAPRIAADLGRLVNDLRDKRPAVGNQLRDIALGEFEAYASASDQRVNELLRAMMIAAAPADPGTRRHLRDRYAATDKAYAEHYRELLVALGREVIDEIGDADGLALVMASVLDGFLARAAIEDDHKTGGRVRHLYAHTVVPLLAALTHPEGTPSPRDSDRLFHGLTPSATATYRRTPPFAAPTTVHAELIGTWRGTMLSDVVARDPEGGSGPRETYLVISTSGGQLRITNHISSGLSRMVLPQFTRIEGGWRLACLYEADLAGNPTPDWPSHRGAWILDTNEDLDELQAVYFNDRSAQGQFVFGDRIDEVCDTYLAAQAACARQFGPWKAAASPGRLESALAGTAHLGA